jgi:hypothetical protein
VATGDADEDDVGVEAGAREDELPEVAELPAAVLPELLPLVALLPVAAALCCAVAGKIATIPATPSTLARPAPPVMAATFLFPRRLAA